MFCVTHPLTRSRILNHNQKMNSSTTSWILQTKILYEDWLLVFKHAYKDKVNKDNINPRFGRDHNALKT